MRRDLKKKLIRLGYRRPQLRPHLRAVLARQDAQELFGELRSILHQRPSRGDYAKVQELLDSIQAVDKRFALQQALPYAVQIARRHYPSKMRSFTQEDLRGASQKLSARFKVLAGSYFSGRMLSSRGISDRELAKAVVGMDDISSMVKRFSFEPGSALTNDEVISLIQRFGKQVMDIEAANLDLPANTLARIGVENFPKLSFYLRGNPKISYNSAHTLADRANIEMHIDSHAEVPLDRDQMMELFRNETIDIFDSPVSKERTDQGGLSWFSRDRRQDRSYSVELDLPNWVDPRFRVHATYQGERTSWTMTFDWPKTDVDSWDPDLSNRHVSGIMRQIEDSLYKHFRLKAQERS